MVKKIENVLVITVGYPSSENPWHCSFIGSRLAYLQNRGIQADVLSFSRITKKNLTSFFKVGVYLFTLFFPIITFTKFIFLGKEYKIYRIFYGYFSEIWIPVIVFILSKLNKYSLIHFHFLWSTDMLDLLKRTINLPTVITVHGSDMHATAATDPVSYLKYKIAISYADKIIYVSAGLREKAKSLCLATNRDVVIHNGYDPHSFFLTHKGNPNFTLGFVGHLYEVKRADKLPEIFMQIKKRISEAKLIIVGGGEQGSSLEEHMRKKFDEYGLNEDVMFIGEVPQNKIVRYYGMMDILLFPSRNEGFGCVAVEARACGVPVIGSSNGGIPEAVGDGGIVVQEGEDFEKRFADAVVNLSKALPLREEIQKKTAELTWDVIIDQEIMVYKEILGFYELNE